MILSDVQLFKLVWAVPIVHIAAAMGVSDQAVRKACLRRGIMTPDRGYWPKVRAGEAMPKPDLPGSFYPASPLKIKPGREGAVVALLSDADASAIRSPREKGDGGQVAAAHVSSSLQATVPSEEGVLEAAEELGQAKRWPSITADIIAAQDGARRREHLLSRVKRLSGSLPELQRLKIDAWLAQERLDLAMSDPAAQLIQSILVGEP